MHGKRTYTNQCNHKAQAISLLKIIINWKKKKKTSIPSDTWSSTLKIEKIKAKQGPKKRTVNVFHASAHKKIKSNKRVSKIMKLTV